MTVTNTKIYYKLVRDLIPKIIRAAGGKPECRRIRGSELRQAIGSKLLEEAHELFCEWQRADPAGILKEAADVVEVLRAALSQYGLTPDDLENERFRRLEERGGFDNGWLLETDGTDTVGRSDGQYPIFIPVPGRNVDVIKLMNSELERSVTAWIASAFYSPGVINLMMSGFQRFFKKGGELKVLLSTMGSITPPHYMKHLRDFLIPGSVRVYSTGSDQPIKQTHNFHAKAYLFRRATGEGAMMIGSSNFTQAGFAENVEWNYFSPSEINLPFCGLSPFDSAVQEFEHIWKKQSIEVTDQFLSDYEMLFKNRFFSKPDQPWTIHSGKLELFETQIGFKRTIVTPNEIQRESLENLLQMRRQGIKRATIIAATGVGKTFLAAFDFKQSGFKSLLYIAHREAILSQSQETFRAVIGDQAFGEIFGAGNTTLSNRPNALFGMVQTLNRFENLTVFPPNAFEYIVVDEFHHSQAETYRKVIDYFKPRFLLGLTATPERMDGKDVLALCDYNVACEVRLIEAVDRGLLCPFQYYAIYDETDYSQITWRGTNYDEKELESALINDTRTSVIAYNLKRLLPSSGKIKALAFCSSVAHAEYTAKKLTLTHGINATALTGKCSDEERYQCLSRLANEEESLSVICTVDIFNEGIDIPEISHVLLLRPTQSFTIYLQQLGRGLRKSVNKNFLVVIDFVGNYKKSYIAPLCLSGFSDEPSFAQRVAFKKWTGANQFLPKGCYIDIDTKVLRVWDDEIRRVIDQRTKKEDRLKTLYQEVQIDLDGISPSMIDFMSSGRDTDPYVYVRVFGNWLRAKKYCDEQFTDYENSLLNTPGEAFLQHVERDLNPVRCYKMVVLQVLLELPGTEWQVTDIAKYFIKYFLDHPEKMFDYDELSSFENPKDIPINRVENKLKTMPLHHLSNKESDYFDLDIKNGKFRIKETIHIYWLDNRFRQLVKDRVDFSMARYFRGKMLRNKVSFIPQIFEEGFFLPESFVRLAFQNRIPDIKRNQTKWLYIGEESFPVTIEPHKEHRQFMLLYKEKASTIEAIRSFVGTDTKEGATAFFVVPDSNGLRVTKDPASNDFPGFKVEISYTRNIQAGFTAIIRKQIADSLKTEKWTITFDRTGYQGKMDIEVRPGDTFTAWTDRIYKDKTRFPARIRAAATALLAENHFGEFHIVAKKSKLDILPK